MTIDLDGFETHLINSGYSRNTVKIYLRRLRTFSGQDADSFASSVSTAHRGGASASTVSSMLAAFKAYCQFAELDTELQYLYKYRTPKPQPPAPHPLPNGTKDVEKLLANSTGAVRVAIALGAYAGLRISESLSISSGSIVHGKLIIRGKGDKVRRVPISEALKRVLDEEITGPGNFIQMCDRSIRSKITQASIASGVRHRDGSPISSHDLRATFATACYENKHDILTVSRLLGHANVNQTQQYLGINEQAMAEAVEF